MPPRIAMQKFVEGSQNLRQTTWFVEGFAFDKPLSSKFVEKKFVEGSLKVITSSLRRPKGLNRHWGISVCLNPLRAAAAASLHGPMAAVSSRAATRKLSARTAVQATTCRQASVLVWAATCSFDRRLGRVCRCDSRRMSMCASRQKSSAAEKSHTICIVSARHHYASRPPSA